MNTAEINNQDEVICTIEDMKLLYIASLSKKEKKAYDIAFQHLGSSFTLEKSIGFLKWTSLRTSLRTSLQTSSN